MTDAAAASPWLSPREAATYARVSETSILRAARRGTLRAFKVGGGRLWRFRPSDVDAWIEAGVQPVPFVPARRPSVAAAAR